MARRLRIPKARTLRTIQDRSHRIGCHLWVVVRDRWPTMPAREAKPDDVHTRSAAPGLPCGQAALDRRNSARTAAHKIDSWARRTVELQEAVRNMKK